MKRVMTSLLCVFMLLALLASCSSSGASGTASSGAAPASTTGSAYDDAIANRTEPAKLVMCLVNYSGTMPAQAQVQEAMNEITREKLNIEVELKFIDIASYKQQMTLMLAGGEQVDIFPAIIFGYTNAISNGFVVDLNEDGLLEKYGQGIIDEMGETAIDACYVDNTLYGVPNQKEHFDGKDGFAIATQYLDGIGYDYGDENIIHIDVDELTDIFSQLHDKYPDKDVTMPMGHPVDAMSIDPLGGDTFGVLLDPLNSLEVEDLFSSDQYYTYCKRYYDWRQMGFISGDALTNEVSAPAQVTAGTLMSFGSPGKPDIRTQFTNQCQQPMAFFQLGENFTSSVIISQFAWCLSTNTVDKVASMQYLNELYTNPELSSLLVWGREGEEYVKTDDGHLTFPEGVDATTSGYMHAVNWEMPNQFIAGVWEGTELDVWDLYRQDNETADISKALGFAFDNTDVLTQYTALTNIYNEYKLQLEYGFTDPDVGIPEMVDRLKKAGLDEYIAAKQAQLDEWAASQT